MVRRFLGNPHRADPANGSDEADFSDDEVFEMIYTLVNASPDHSDVFTDDSDDEDYVPGDDVDYDSEYDSDEPGPPIHDGDGEEDGDGDFTDGESASNTEPSPETAHESGSVA